jgi:hypothetical protein
LERGVPGLGPGVMRDMRRLASGSARRARFTSYDWPAFNVNALSWTAIAIGGVCWPASYRADKTGPLS